MSRLSRFVPKRSLVAAAEALSAARPGARREALESYVKRLEKLESLATAFTGVQKAYAIQAGREIRVIVTDEDLTDPECFQFREIWPRKIEQELTYPGQIKVTVIRESRFVTSRNECVHMKVLMIGDIMGEPGRRAVARLLPKLIAKHNIDVVIGNGENVAGGFGITPGLSWMTFSISACR